MEEKGAAVWVPYPTLATNEVVGVLPLHAVLAGGKILVVDVSDV